MQQILMEIMPIIIAGVSGLIVGWIGKSSSKQDRNAICFGNMMGYAMAMAAFKRLECNGDGFNETMKGHIEALGHNYPKAYKAFKEAESMIETSEHLLSDATSKINKLKDKIGSSS